MKLEDFATKFNGTVQGQYITFKGSLKAPKNSLTIPLIDLGYNPKNGIFRKSLAPEQRSILEI